MVFSPPRLHAPVALSPSHRQTVRAQFAALAAPKPVELAASNTPVAIPLTTVSMSGNFDAYIQIQPPGGSPVRSLVFDSGNSMLIMPYWSDFENASGYAVLGGATEPWGCPAKVVRGPIAVVADGGVFTIPNCVFYACTGPNDQNELTANFGGGCVTPWSSNGWNVPKDCNVVMQAPLSYAAPFTTAVIDYAVASQMLTLAAEPLVASGSWVTVYQNEPSGFTTFAILPNLEWMSLDPVQLSIDGTVTGWPGTQAPAIAMIDTGGGPAFLSDPYGYVYNRGWPDPVANPGWVQMPPSVSCESTGTSITIALSGGSTTYAYTIDPSTFPPSAQGLSLVMCESNQYMMDQYGMNVGGITALVNAILIDYAAAKVGFRQK
jgi:hypothetical protein